MATEAPTRVGTVTVVNQHTHTPGPHTVYCGRPGPLGNPYVIGKDGTRKEVIAKFALDFTEALLCDTALTTYADEFMRLQVRVENGEPLELMCHCAPLPCHCDVIRGLLIGEPYDSHAPRPAAPQRPSAPKPVCVIQSATKPRREYFDLEDAFADIARAKERGGYLLVGVVGSRNLDTVARNDDYAVVVADALVPGHEHRRALAAVARGVNDIRVAHGVPLAKVAIVSGGARGVDTLAEDFARENKLPLIVFPAHWNRAADGKDAEFDKLAGFKRNSHIVSVIDALLALPRNETKADGTHVPSAKSGTYDTITKARLAQVPVTIK